MEKRRMMRPVEKEYTAEISILVDPEQVDTPEKERAWKRQVEKTLGDLLDLGIITVENWT